MRPTVSYNRAGSRLAIASNAMRSKRHVRASSAKWFMSLEISKSGRSGKCPQHARQLFGKTA